VLAADELAALELLEDVSDALAVLSFFFAQTDGQRTRARTTNVYRDRFFIVG
jgi:hypothetical protein